MLSTLLRCNVFKVIKIFCDRLKKLRSDKEISQAKLAILFNVAQQTIDKWERGITMPDIETVVKLAIFFEVPTDYLLGLSNNMYSNDNNGDEEIIIRGAARSKGNVPKTLEIKTTRKILDEAKKHIHEE